MHVKFSLLIHAIESVPVDMSQLTSRLQVYCLDLTLNLLSCAIWTHYLVVWTVARRQYMAPLELVLSSFKLLQHQHVVENAHGVQFAIRIIFTS